MDCDRHFWFLVAVVTVALVVYKLIARALRVVGYALEEWRWRRRRRNQPGIDVNDHDGLSSKDSNEE